MRRAKDLTGQRFNRLVVLGPNSRDSYGAVLWLCRCDCGRTTTAARTHDLTSGATQSCGCLRKEHQREAVARGPNPITTLDGIVYMVLQHRDGLTAAITVLDADLYSIVEPYRWSVSLGYVVSSEKKKTWMHRLLIGNNLAKSSQVDHIDGDKLNNRRSNLRIATPMQNSWNITKTWARSGFKGVDKSGRRWRATITHAGVVHRLGSFDTPEEAARAYNEAALLYFGEFAHINILP